LILKKRRRSMAPVIFARCLPSCYPWRCRVSSSCAGYFRTMFTVMLPMAMPSIIIVILFNFLLFWNEYILALTLMPGENKTLPVGLLNLLAAERAAVNYGPMYAGM